MITVLRILDNKLREALGEDRHADCHIIGMALYNHFIEDIAVKLKSYFR
jgi:hypothetical protein